VRSRIIKAVSNYNAYKNDKNAAILKNQFAIKHPIEN